MIEIINLNGLRTYFVLESGQDQDQQDLFKNLPNPNASKLRVFSSVGCAVRTVKILTGWDFGAHGTPYYDPKLIS